MGKDEETYKYKHILKIMYMYIIYTHVCIYINPISTSRWSHTGIRNSYFIKL